MSDTNFALELIAAEQEIERLRSELKRERQRKAFIASARQVYSQNLKLHGRILTLERQLKRAKKVSK